MDVSGLKMALSDKQSDLPQVARSGISTILADPDTDANGVVNRAG